MMSAQQVFDKAYRHLISQNARAEEHFNCKYRTDRGLKCGVGCLIDDEHYSEDMEGGKADCYQVSAALKSSGVDSVEHHVLLAEIQFLYDNYEPPRWADHFRQIAATHGLSVPKKANG